MNNMINVTMNQITDFLLQQGFYETGYWNEPLVKNFGKEVDGVKFVYRIMIKPKYIVLEADTLALFDDWESCPYYATFNSFEDFQQNWFTYLETYNF